MFKYSTPGDVSDIGNETKRADFLDDWHAYISGQFQDNIRALGPGSLFFTEVDTAAEGDPVPIHWNGFPLTLLRTNRNIRRDAWKDAEVLQQSGRGKFRKQDEYCEWFVYKKAGRIEKIVFTAEGPEYWEKLAEHDFDTVLALYRKLVNPAVQGADLLKDGSYDRLNVWNTERGVIHLTHPANTLGAEINLAAIATVPRIDAQGQRVTDVRRLACCANFGDPNRSSDPNIGWAVNTTCLPIAGGATPQAATLADPVGLYMDRLLPQTLTGPGNTPVDDWFTFRRGKAGRGLMAVLEPPAGAAFGLDQVKVMGVPLEWGGQVAERIEMVLYARVGAAELPHPSSARCVAHCCMPSGTSPTRIKDVNLQHTDAGARCANGAVDAYPELADPAAGAGPMPMAVATSAPRRTRSRLATE
ncbi:hypothetical protein [Methylobacterium sp. SyP6R]|uniref:hypothetical protein n=1 Tax=Methylobacterium sp. SyP6R TaxID=2718876 RepID=UPI001F214CB7|nr:hypothetical protein [Methylobacterium sp. SyP6R]MCF4130040.1 hypothetical protein [Methylobacterium sp. SyP6R]